VPARITLPLYIIGKRQNIEWTGNNNLTLYWLDLVPNSSRRETVKRQLRVNTFVVVRIDIA